MDDKDSVFDGGWKIADMNTLIAYLWEQADRPEPLEAARKAVRDCPTWHLSTPAQVDAARIRAANEAFLAALIGPRPAEQEADDDAK